MDFDISQSQDKLKTLLKGMRYCMLTTTSPAGILMSRPMSLLEHDSSDELWFFTAKSCAKTQAIVADPRVNLSFADAKTGKYISLSGTAQLSDNPAKMKELWSSMYKAWFPLGLADPDLTLLKVKVETAEYWEAPYSKVVQFFGLARAAFTGEPYHASRDEHGRIEVYH